MRLKQLLGVILLLVATATVAAAASQLTDLNVAGNGNVTTVTFRANGTFTHNEYRPTDNLLLVDLAGVAPARFAGVMKDVHVPGVSSYHVLNYKGTAGAEVTRIELALLPGSLVNIADTQGGLAVRITANAFPPPAATATSPITVPTTPAAPAADAAKPAAAKPVLEKPAKPAAKPQTEAAPVVASGRTVKIQNISVVRGKNSVDVEITGSGPMTPKSMKLSAPDRVVLDVMNSVPIRKQQIDVNSGDVKVVRMARYQENPPVTRIVVDMAASRDYEVVPSGNKLTLRLHTAGNAASTPAPGKSNEVVLAQNTVPMLPANASGSPAPSVAPVQLKMPSQPKDFVFLEPSYHPKVETANAPPAKPEVAMAQPVASPPAAVEAAARFAHADAPTASTNLQSRNAAPGSAAMSSKAVNAAMMQQQANPMPVATARARYTGEPISVNLKDVDLKDFFRLIHEISGLNIVLDPNVKGSLTLVLDDVPWDQALDIVLQNNGLDKQLVGNVLRIATVDTLRKEADANRAKEEALALAVPTVTYTHYLSYAHSADVLPTVKKFLSARGDVIADTRTNALIIQDIPAIIPKAQQLLVQLDRKTQEVEIEARVVAATRSFARDIGTQLGFGTGGKTFAVGGAAAVGTSPLLVNGLTPSFFTLGNSIPLFSNLPAIGPTSGISVSNATNAYRLDFILTAAETRGLLKILSRPRVVTQNNIVASVRQGVKIPVVTAAQLGGPPTVTYVDAFLRLTVTPQITAENTIFLNVDVENTTPDFSRQINNNPTLLTQQAVTQVLVNDGGTVVIGGVIQTQNSVNNSQVPLLGSIPVLGNLFKRRSVSTSTQELIFFITPKIIQT
jgi:type IV pilus assembly protein PilQ